MLWRVKDGVQLSRALDSVVLDVAEGSGSQGRNRRAGYFNALVAVAVPAAAAVPPAESCYVRGCIVG